MAFPIPHFDEFDDTPESVRAAGSAPMEMPFSLNRRYSFTEPAQTNLLYDIDKPLYSSSKSGCTVFVAQSKRNKSKYYALKSSHYIKRLRNEFENFQLIGSYPTITKCYDYWISKGEGFLQFELAKYGSIRHNFEEFTEKEIWQVIAHISSALARIHSKGMIHLDVSLANILHHETSHGAVFKLTDFGTMKKIGTFDEDDEGAGPYVSPEALAYPHTKYEIGPKTDIWSFGIVLYELVTKKFAPRDYPGYENLRKGKFKFEKIPRQYSFILDMLNVNPEKRPTAASISSFENCRIEMAKFSEKEGSPIPSTKYVAQTPAISSIKVPPDTPYLKKYGRPPRKLSFDDEEFQFGPDL